MAYKKSDPFYHGKEWKQLRKAALHRDQGMCQDCMDAFRRGVGGKPRRAEMVHHLVPREERPDLALVLENLRSLCNQCHNKRHPEKRRHVAIQKKEQALGHMRVIKV